MEQKCCFCHERAQKVIYIKQSSFMYVAFLDASNAFDRVNNTKLFYDLNVSLSKQPVGCCCGKTVVNHLMYADDIVLLAPSAKGLLAPSAKGLLAPSAKGLLAPSAKGLLAPSAKGLLASSTKGLQRLLDASYTYGCDKDIVFNNKKSQVMFVNTMKSGHVANITLGEITLNVTKSYKYLRHVINYNLCDETDIKAKERGFMAGAMFYLEHFISVLSM